jgi:hypothetical protein
MRWLIAGLVALVVMTVSEPLLATSSYKWKYRPLFIFADSNANSALAEQRRIFAASRAGLVERQVVVIWVIGDSVSNDGGLGPRQTAAPLRARYGVGPTEFKAVLVGKDGGVKLASSSAIRAEILYSTIDAMPMRRDEMRRR